MVRNIIACQKDFENPKPMQESTIRLLILLTNYYLFDVNENILVPRSPIIITSFLPPFSESDNLPHIMAVRNCAPVKLLAISPAWVAITESGRVSSKDLS